MTSSLAAHFTLNVTQSSPLAAKVGHLEDFPLYTKKRVPDQDRDYSAEDTARPGTHSNSSARIECKYQMTKERFLPL